MYAFSIEKVRRKFRKKKEKKSEGEGEGEKWKEGTEENRVGLCNFHMIKQSSI